MISALIIAPPGTGRRALWAAILSSARLDAHVTSIQDAGEAIQILRSIRFELMVIDLRDGEGAATQILEFLGNERPQDLERILLVSESGGISEALRGQARVVEGTGPELEMPILGQSISSVMGDIIPELRIYSA